MHRFRSVLAVCLLPLLCMPVSAAQRPRGPLEIVIAQKDPTESLVVLVIRNGSSDVKLYDELRLSKLQGDGSWKPIAHWWLSQLDSQRLSPLRLESVTSPHPAVIVSTAQGIRSVDQLPPATINPRSELLVRLTGRPLGAGTYRVQAPSFSPSRSFKIQEILRSPFTREAEWVSQFGGVLSAQPQVPLTAKIIIRRWTGTSWERTRTVSPEWYGSYSRQPGRVLDPGLYYFQFDPLDTEVRVLAGVPG